MNEDPHTGLVITRRLLPRRYARLARVHLDTLWASSPAARLECHRLTPDARGEPAAATTTFWSNAFKLGPNEDILE